MSFNKLKVSEQGLSGVLSFTVTLRASGTGSLVLLESNLKSAENRKIS